MAIRVDPTNRGCIVQGSQVDDATIQRSEDEMNKRTIMATVEV